MLTSLHLHMKSRRVCIKTRSPAASLPLKGQVTRHATVKWPIASSPVLEQLILALEFYFEGSFCRWHVTSFRVEHRA